MGAAGQGRSRSSGHAAAAADDDDDDDGDAAGHCQVVKQRQCGRSQIQEIFELGALFHGSQSP